MEKEADFAVSGGRQFPPGRLGGRVRNRQKMHRHALQPARKPRPRHPVRAGRRWCQVHQNHHRVAAGRHNVYTSSVYMQIIAYRQYATNRPQLVFLWCRNPPKLLAGRRLRRRPCIYVISAGNVCCSYKKKIAAAIIYRLSHNTSSDEKKKRFSQ